MTIASFHTSYYAPNAFTKLILRWFIVVRGSEYKFRRIWRGFFPALATALKCLGARQVPPTVHIRDANVGLRTNPRDLMRVSFRRV